jgi:hypothetical protein
MKTEIIVKKPRTNDGLKPMGDMQIGEICEVIAPWYRGAIVFRSNESPNGAIIELTNLERLGCCWTDLQPGKGLLVKPFEPGTEITIKILEDKSLITPCFNKDDKKEFTILHYERMISFAKGQPDYDRPDKWLMEERIGETWDGQDCFYCKERNEKGNSYCKLGPNNICSGSDCCGGNWSRMSTSKTWGEFIKGAEKTLDYIKQNG